MDRIAQLSETAAKATLDVMDELTVAVRKFPPMRSAHEGFAILNEEVDELWDEVKAKPDAQSRAKLYLEAKQVAAMALRFMVDVCSPEPVQK